MFEMFLNPWAMAAGTLLISSPIIIHLINRMRYRRIRWAAMEFLLKSQKKNRRRVIIEQIILLLLRIVLVLLAGFLLARFIGAMTGSQQSTRHVVLLNDTPSMADTHREDGKEMTAFAQAKRVVTDIANFASEATTPQSLTLIRMTDPDNPRHIERLNATTVAELNQFLSDLEPSPVHVDTVRGLRAAEAVLNESKEEKRLPGRRRASRAGNPRSPCCRGKGRSSAPRRLPGPRRGAEDRPLPRQHGDRGFPARDARRRPAHAGRVHRVGRQLQHRG